MKIVAYNIVAENRIYQQVDTKAEATVARREYRAANPGIVFDIEPVR